MDFLMKLAEAEILQARDCYYDYYSYCCSVWKTFVFSAPPMTSWERSRPMLQLVAVAEVVVVAAAVVEVERDED